MEEFFDDFSDLALIKMTVEMVRARVKVEAEVAEAVAVEMENVRARARARICWERNANTFLIFYKSAHTRVEYDTIFFCSRIFWF